MIATLITMFLAIILLISSAQGYYDCIDLANITQPHVFKTLEDYKTSDLSFKTENNWVSFSSNIPRLPVNGFIKRDSNFIRKISLDDKQIREIDDGAFSELFCVKILLLQNNKLFDLNTDTFLGMELVEELNLSHNELTGIAANAFSKINHLLKLDLSYNNIKQLSTDTFASLENLWELHLSHNQLVDLPSNLFKPVIRIRWLFLGYNKMAVLTTPSLRFLEHLDVLDLSNNDINYIFEGMLRSLVKVSSLDLSGNDLKKLDILALHTSMPMLAKINLNQNTWQCAELEKMLTDLERLEINVVLTDGVKKAGVKIYEIGCYNGTDQVSSTSSPKETDVTFYDDSEVLAAIENLKSYIIATLIILMISAVVVVVFQANWCNAFGRRRGVLSFQSSTNEDPSLPLLAR